MATQPPSADLVRLFEIQKQNMNGIARAQGRYVVLLLGFVTLLWGWQFVQPKGLSVQVSGVSLQLAGLWAIAPGFLTIVSLALIGSMNAMGPAWHRLSDTAQKLGANYFWSELDTNKNIVDYLVYLRIWPEGPAEPISAPADITRKFKFTVFSYPLAVLVGIITTFRANEYMSAATFRAGEHVSASWTIRLYIYGCALLQIIYGFRIWYRAVCRFFALRRPQTEI